MTYAYSYYTQVDKLSEMSVDVLQCKRCEKTTCATETVRNAKQLRKQERWHSSVASPAPVSWKRMLPLLVNTRLSETVDDQDLQHRRTQSSKDHSECVGKGYIGVSRSNRTDGLT